MLEQEISDAVEKEDFTKMKSLLRHTEHFIAQNSVLSKSETASLCGELGCICYYLCYYPHAQELLHLGISELNKHPTTEHAKIAHFLVYSGNIHRRLGDYDKSIKLFEQSIELYKKSSELHTGMARAYGYLGITHESLGAFDKAKALLEKSLIIHRKSSKNKVGHAWSLAHLGSVYKNIGDYIEAKKLYEESFRIYKSSSPYHVGVAWVCRDLGFIYAMLGEKEKAKNLLEESLAIYRQHFFEDHIYIAQALIYLGIFYRETKDFEKAKNLLKKGLVVIEKTYGKNHADTGAVLKEIGKTFLAEGNLKIAEEMMNQTHSIFTKINHPDKYEVLEILATICQKKSLTLANRGESPAAMRLKAQARFYLAQALKVVKTYFPEDSPHSNRIQSKIKHEEQNKG
jgi:tetratricopeptide (TPR) repeat protein